MQITGHQGHARQLVTAALELSGARNIRCAKLDATNEGKPLYTSLGFEDEQPIERWRRAAGPVPSHQPVAGGEIPRNADRIAFAVDRWKFVQTLGEPVVYDNSYALHRPGAKAHYLGPCVARNTASAYRLIAATLAQNPRSALVLGSAPVQSCGSGTGAGLRVRTGPPIDADGPGRADTRRR